MVCNKYNYLKRYITFLLLEKITCSNLDISKIINAIFKISIIRII